MKKWVILLLGYLFSALSFAAEKHVTLHIEEMNCQLCVYLVNKELRAIDGVISTKGNFNDRLVKIVAEEKVTNEQLIQAIDKLHYHAIVKN
ncbi:heavy-metal-associated domain-containing protein [Lonepinella sp. BR2271]|uniref:heavy-metal-associated domain-containing protein n=1 Tax=Lonepinella sp. BR2271 TaxID=3434550 RepID=UPI003F6E41A6